MLLALSTTATAQDATLNFNYLITGLGASTYTVIGDPVVQTFFADCALQTGSLRADTFTVSARLTQNNRTARSSFGNVPATISYIKYATKLLSAQNWQYGGLLAASPVDTGVTFSASVCARRSSNFNLRSKFLGCARFIFRVCKWNGHNRHAQG